MHPNKVYRMRQDLSGEPEQAFSNRYTYTKKPSLK